MMLTLATSSESGQREDHTVPAGDREQEQGIEAGNSMGEGECQSESQSVPLSTASDKYPVRHSGQDSAPVCDLGAGDQAENKNEDNTVVVQASGESHLGVELVRLTVSGVEQNEARESHPVPGVDLLGSVPLSPVPGPRNGSFLNPTDGSAPLNPLEPVPSVLRPVEGIDKLRRAIGKELVSESSNEKCSNLPHLLSIVDCVLPPPLPPASKAVSSEDQSGGSDPDSPDFGGRRRKGEVRGKRRDYTAPSAVLKPFNYLSRSHEKTVRFIVDIVSPDGDEWSKVSARNPKSLALLAAGGGGFGQKSILDHAHDYLECAKQNPAFFKPPRVNFIFTSGIGMSLALELESLGIRVKGERIEDSELAAHPRIKPYQHLLYESDSNSEEELLTAANESLSNGSSGEGDDGGQTHRKPKAETNRATTQIRNRSLEGITKLNLDITALLAYVSNLTNGHTNVHFKTAILTQQLESEKRNPQKPLLDSIFRGRELYCCETAFKEFRSILATVGGSLERQRAIDFLERLKIVPDQMSERSKLNIVGNIKLRSLTIFGTGDSLEAVTVTANSGFVRSARTQGVDFPVFLHESRALTESKEKYSRIFI